MKLGRDFFEAFNFDKSKRIFQNSKYFRSYGGLKSINLTAFSLLHESEKCKKTIYILLKLAKVPFCNRKISHMLNSFDDLYHNEKKNYVEKIIMACSDTCC